MSRKITTAIIAAAEDNALSWEQIARAALNFMSEDDVADMAEAEGFIGEERAARIDESFKNGTFWEVD